MDPIHVHLMVNHAPVIGTILKVVPSYARG